MCSFFFLNRFHQNCLLYRHNRILICALNCFLSFTWYSSCFFNYHVYWSVAYYVFYNGLHLFWKKRLFSNLVHSFCHVHRLTFAFWIMLGEVLWTCIFKNVWDCPFVTKGCKNSVTGITWNLFVRYFSLMKIRFVLTGFNPPFFS